MRYETKTSPKPSAEQVVYDELLQLAKRTIRIDVAYTALQMAKSLRPVL